MERYKVETLDYTYEWLDVGPGPRERGRCTGMSSMVRRYNKAYHTSEEALEELRRLQSLRCSPDVIIVSKMIKREYIPGKLTVQTRGEVVWSPIPEYIWKRDPYTKINFFELVTKDGRYEIVHQSYFLKIEPTFAELVNTVFDSEMFKKAFWATFKPSMTFMEKINPPQ